MIRNLIFDEQPTFIQDLGSGYSNVHLNIKQVDCIEHDEESNKDVKVKKWSADVQKVDNPVTYEKTVTLAIKEEFPNGEDEAALRKGIVNPKDEDFVKLNSFAEYVKKSFKKGI